ncbi:MAG: DUF1559 domain-containing protein [Rubripirellula sp.]
MIEVCAVLVLITIMIWLLLPAVQSAREMARRTSCANNLMQVGLGVRAYQSSFGHFPVQMHGTDGSMRAGLDNDRRLSFLVGVLPYVAQPELFEMMSQPLDRSTYRGYDDGMEMYYEGEMDGDDLYLSQEELVEYEQEMSGDVVYDSMTADSMTADSMTASDDMGGLDVEGGEENIAGANLKVWPSNGPEPFQRDYYPFNTEPAVYRCPSDPGVGRPSMGRTNYVACLGDGLLASDTGPFKEIGGVFVLDAELAKQTRAAMRGAFVPRVLTSDSDIKDGISHTILLGEIATDLGDQDIRTTPIPGPGAPVLRDNPNWIRSQTEGDFGSADYIDPERPLFWDLGGMSSKLSLNIGQRRGFRWADGAPLYTGFNTILPPNREIVMYEDRDDCWGVLGSSSRHQGGANVAMVDASVRFVTDSIDAGDSNQPSVYDGSVNPPESQSPYGVWGALGTRDSGELGPQQIEPWE